MVQRIVNEMWICPDVPVDNLNKPHIEAVLIVTGHVHLDDDKIYIVEHGEVKDMTNKQAKLI